ncbi:hypothetical protein [Microbacterium sp. NPDC089188]|uniref:hypothetical protein n=1 Tax=Microbacterium sp. NPDC089188 TaxID=3154971 RepID=UPI00342A2E36
MTFQARRPSVRGGEAGLRAGMSTAEMLERFARLNGLDPRDAMQHIADATAPAPFLRARLVADRLAAESGAAGGAVDAAIADPFFDRWLAARGLVAHRGVTWTRVRTLGHHPVVLTLAAIARLRTRAELVRLDDDLRRGCEALGVDVLSPGAPAVRRDGLRGFSHPARPWQQAGVHVSAMRPWRWVEWERFATVLHHYGLRARFGLEEDQVAPTPGVPLVIWNPTAAAIPLVGGTAATVELRVVGRVRG